MGLMLSNFTLRIKLLLMVAIFAATTAPLFIVSYSTIRQQNVAISSVLFVEFSRQEALSQLTLAMTRSNGALYEATALSNAGVSDARMKALLSLCRKHLGDVDRALTQIKSDPGLGDQVKEVEITVAASEVKNLAKQTAQATEDITSQIKDIQTVAGGAAQAIEGVGGTIEQINNIVTTIAAAVEEQSAATEEIARNVQEASHSTHDVSMTIDDVTAAASETMTIADRVLAAAKNLLSQSETLDNEVNNFIGRVRVA